MTLPAPKTQRHPINVGQHKHHTQCRFCSSEDMTPVIDFGYVPLARGFLKSDSTKETVEREKKYPLQICFCPKCNLLQVNNIVDSDTLFKDYFYFSSAIKTLVDHFDAYAKELKQQYKDAEKRLVVEIGSNDGVFLKPLKREGFRVVGVDPAVNVASPLLKEGYDVEIACFEDVADKIVQKHGKADVITSSNSFAHIDNMHAVIQGVKKVLKDDGILLIEVHYLGTLMKEIQYDMMYHEHQSYYSLHALTNFFDMYEMEVYDVLLTSIHAGSIRYYVQNKHGGTHTVTQTVKDLLKSEKEMGLEKIETFQHFSSYLQKVKKELRTLLLQLKKDGKKIAGYGASGRATAIMAYSEIGPELLDYVIDDAPAKQGAYTPGNHLKICPSDVLNTADRPDYCLVFAWSFIQEIKKKNIGYLQKGGKFIVPLPEVKVVGVEE
jgi:SAM-dependent methyltransferase